MLTSLPFTDVAKSVEKPDLYFDVDAKGTYNVAKACEWVSVPASTSTCAVYGESVKLPIAENHPVEPKSPYSATKATGEACDNKSASKAHG